MSTYEPGAIPSERLQPKGANSRIRPTAVRRSRDLSARQPPFAAPVGEWHIGIFGKVRRGSIRANLKCPIGGAVLGKFGTCVTRRMIGPFSTQDAVRQRLDDLPADGELQCQAPIEMSITSA